MTEQRVTVTITDGVADVRLNRPEKRNALDNAMFAGLITAGERLKSEPGVRAVVLSGEGPDFCAGLDFGAFQAMRDGERLSLQVDLPPAQGPARATGQRAAYVWAELPVPVIAAVTGNALGGGLQIALGADIRIVAPDARMSVLEIRWGLIPDMTGSQLLPELVGRDVAKDLTFSGRVVSGTEAVALGLATRTDPDPRGPRSSWPAVSPPAARTPSGPPSDCSTWPAGSTWPRASPRSRRRSARSSAARIRSRRSPPSSASARPSSPTRPDRPDRRPSRLATPRPPGPSMIVFTVIGSVLPGVVVR